MALDVYEDPSAWSALEELNLLNAIEHYSFGNWKDIAHHVGTRSANESKEHYVNRFIEGSIGKATWSSYDNCRPVLCNLVDTDDKALAHKNASTLPHIDVQPQEALQLYYYPFRDDFEIEYDNQAEALVSSLTLDGEDDDLDIALKLTQVDMYTERLRERERRHRILRDHQLIANFFRHTESRKKASKDERMLREKCLPFTQFYTGEEYKQLLDNLINNCKLSRRLAELMRYRHFGLRNFDDLPEFEKQTISRHNVSIELLPLVERKKKKKHKKKLLFSAKRTYFGKRPFLRFGA